MKRLFIAITIALLTGYTSVAQEPAESMVQNYSPEVLKKAAELEAAERAKKHKEEITEKGKELKKTKYKGWKEDQLMYVADSLENELSKLKSYESEIQSNRAESQQLLEAAEMKNASAAELREQLEKKAADTDRMAARFCNIRLSQRYKPEWHAEVMEIIPTITTQSVIADYTPVFELLEVYPKYFEEVKGVIGAAYREGQDALKNGGSREDFFTKWTNAIKSTEYYKKHYNTDNNIFYLDQQISTFLKLMDQKRSNISQFYLVAFPKE